MITVSNVSLRFGKSALFEDVNINEDREITEAKYTEDISVTVKCKDDDEAEELFERLTEEGYECHISTL